MNPTIFSLRRSRPAFLLLWLGLATLLLNAFAVHCRGEAKPATALSVLEICSNGSRVRLDAFTLEPLAAVADSVGGMCCCHHGPTAAIAVVATTWLLLPFRLDSGDPVGVPDRQSPPPRLAAAALRPIVPRGPPATG